jgi:Holliday junction resolvase RusA-like endonuclease
MISFTLSIVPVAKGRPRWDRRGFMVTPALTRRFERDVARAAAAYKPPSPLTGPLRVCLRFVFKPPVKWARDHHTIKPDCSNLAKGVEDALNGIFWSDDSVITDLRVMKLYDFAERKPRIEVQIEEIMPRGEEG